MANNDLILIGLFGAVAVGAMFWIGKKKKDTDFPPLGPNTGGQIPISTGPGALPGFRTDPNTGYTIGQYRIPGTPLQLDPMGIAGVLKDPNYSKVGIPITGGSAGWDDVHEFTTRAQGTCQCDNRECCYRAQYYPETGGPIGKKACVTIKYGDVPTACQEAFRQFSSKTFSTRAYSARDYIA